MGLDNFSDTDKSNDELVKKGPGYTYTREELIRFLVRFKEREDEKLYHHNFNTHKDYPSAGTLRNTFGSWNEAIEAAGLTKTGYDKERIIELLRRFKTEEDVKFTSEEFTSHPNYPSERTVAKYFGTWNKALEAAGIKKGKVVRGKDREIEDPSKEKAYSIGALLGDGSISETKTGDMIKFSTVDKEFASELGCRLGQWLNIKWKGFDSPSTEISCYVQEHSDNRQTQYHLCKNVTNMSNHIKKVYNSSLNGLKENFKEHKAYMIRGLWDAEGSIFKNDGRIVFSNSDKKLIRLYIDFTTSILDIEVDGNVDTDNLTEVLSENPYMHIYKRESSTGTKGYADMYEVYIHRLMCGEFYDKVNPTIHTKRRVFRNYM